MPRTPPVYTSLGMHYLQLSTGVALVQIDVNVRGLIAVHARRLCKSKRGMAMASSGTVRLALANPESQELATAALEQGNAAATNTIDSLITTVHDQRRKIAALELATCRQCTQPTSATAVFNAS